MKMILWVGWEPGMREVAGRRRDGKKRGCSWSLRVANGITSQIWLSREDGSHICNSDISPFHFSQSFLWCRLSRRQTSIHQLCYLRLAPAIKTYISFVRLLLLTHVLLFLGRMPPSSPIVKLVLIIYTCLIRPMLSRRVIQTNW